MESEKQYGRRRLIRKPQKFEKTEEKEKKEITRIEKTEQPSEKPETERQQPIKKEDRNEVRTSRERPSRPPSRGQRRYPKTRSEKPDRENIQKRHPRQTTTRPQPKPGKPGAVKLSVIIPAFNEESNVAPLLEQFNQLFSKLPYRAELICVNDGSTDKTSIRLKEGQLNYPWLKVFTHRINRGLTTALKTGFSKAIGKIWCYYPADLQYHANELPKMISKIDSGADIVTGWKQGGYGLKSISSFIYNTLSRWLFKVKVHDLNSIKAFKKEVVEHFGYRSGWHRYMVVMAAGEGYVVDEIRVKLYPRRSGKSKFGFWRLPKGFLDLLSVKFQLSFTKKPLLFFCSAGLLSGLLGFIIGLVALYFRFVQNAGYRPLLYAVILLMVSGLMLFAIGFLAELIVGVKEDINKRKTDF